MTDLINSAPDPVIKARATRELLAFFALAFGITFGLGAAVIFFRPQFESIFGPLGPLLTSWPYYLAVSAPTISAVFLSAVFGGFKSVKALFSGLVRPFLLRWIFIALLTFPIALLLWALAERCLFGANASASINVHAILISAPITLLTTTHIAIDPGPWGEETGWRGFALPRLLTRLSPFRAAIILGIIWGAWHTPAFFISGLTQANYNFGWFILATIGTSILMTWIYINANRNFLVAGFIPHAINNLMAVTGAFVDVKIQAFVLMAITAFIIVVSGPGLKGWRFGRQST
jgi:uncharacterized protein